MRPGSRRPAPTPSPAALAAMTGAVDLAAVKARSEAAARAAAAPPPSGGTYVIDATEANFQAEVLDRSFQVPVLLDLWADWCEPCKQLSPVLEKLANEAAGAWVLAKVDVEANQRIAGMLQVQSIPTVFAVIGGQLIPGFQGALPEPQVREFIGALLEAAQQAGLSGQSGAAPDGEVVQEPEDERFTAAEQALQDGDFDLAAERYQAILNAEPANLEAQLALRQVGLLQRLAGLPADALARAAAAPDDVELQLAAADAELANNLVDEAFNRLIGLIRRLRGEDRDPVRDRLVEYFELLGPDDPRVGPARRNLASALF
ncbi:MAG TPA: tetratricopeptide repeat protein [Jatrophihabitans sp.]|nr:tetratricopeptide repeat protein [Jatrophihabitans sp.]